jgi:hypothetical protein
MCFTTTVYVMKQYQEKTKGTSACKVIYTIAAAVIIAVVCPFNVFCESPQKPIKPVKRTPPVELPDSIRLNSPVSLPAEVVADSLEVSGNQVSVTPVDSFPIFNAENISYPDSVRFTGIKLREFNPDPVRAVWYSALFPGLGQVYNRRYWKLPLVVAGFMGLGYGTSWNNGMLRDYTRAYADIMDNDPSTKSYMDFFPTTVREEDLDKTWLTNVLKSRKDYYRRNRDLCIISMVGVYLLAMVDAYVDASLAHFDISPDLSMDVAPAMIPDRRNRPGVGLQWALRF